MILGFNSQTCPNASLSDKALTNFEPGLKSHSGVNCVSSIRFFGHSFPLAPFQLNVENIYTFQVHIQNLA